MYIVLPSLPLSHTHLLPGHLSMQEPEAYKVPDPEPTFATFTREPGQVEEGTPKELKLRLVGSHPLWGHLLWNAAKRFAWRLDGEKELVRGRRVLELGAAAGLPSLVAAGNGASQVVMTDYPDPDLMGNMEYNARSNFPELVESGRLAVRGYIWGQDVEELMRESPSKEAEPFDVIILSDLLFNHSQHRNLLWTCKQTLSRSNPDARVYVFFTHHRPHLADKDMAFFTLATLPEYGFKVTRVEETRMDPMFPEDPGSEEVRATVHGFKLTWSME